MSFLVLYLIQLMKRELIALPLMSSECHVAVIVICLFLAVLKVGV